MTQELPPMNDRVYMYYCNNQTIKSRDVDIRQSQSLYLQFIDMLEIVLNKIIHVGLMFFCSIKKSPVYR